MKRRFRRKWTIFSAFMLSLLASCAEQKESKPAEATQEWVRLGPPPVSDDEFDKLYTKAKAGDGEAAYSVYLAILLRQHKAPEGVKPSELLKQAAEAGVLEAQCSYYSFLMSSPDRATREGAVVWLEAAAKRGFEPAIEGLEMHAELLKMSDKP